MSPKTTQKLAAFFDNNPLPPCWMAVKCGDGYVAELLYGYVVVGFYLKSREGEDATAIIVKNNGQILEAGMVLAAPIVSEKRSWVPLIKAQKPARKRTYELMSTITRALELFFSEVLSKKEFSDWTVPLNTTYWSQVKEVGIVEPEPAPDEQEQIERARSQTTNLTIKG